MPPPVSRHRPLLLAAAVAALLFCAPAAQAARLRIVKPAPNRFFAHAPVRVEVRAPRAAGSLRARIDGRAVSSSFRRVRPGLWRASLGAGRLRPGADHLVVSAGVGGQRDYDGSRFYLGKRRRAFLSLAGPSRGAGGVVARVEAKGEPDILRATLNGRRLRWPLQPWALSSLPLRLGADDGLHFGVNRLRVFAARRNGTFDVERRTVRVPRDRPLPGAGRDRRVGAGGRVRLDGTSSRAALGARASLGYRWRIVRRPRGSRGMLLGAGSARPLLKADRPGVYRVRMTVTETGRTAAGQRLSRSASDTVTLRAVANVPPIGMPIETIDFNGGNTEETADAGIRLGSRVYWMGMPKGNSIQALILERETLEVLYAATYPGTQANAETLEGEVKKYGSKGLVVISNPDIVPNSGVNSAFLPIVESLGIDKEQAETLKLGRAGWSVIGVPGSKTGAYFGAGESFDGNGPGDVRGNLSGYLEEGNLRSYGFNFVPASRVLFETSAPGAAAGRNTIKIGSAAYPSEALASCGEGGFQAEVVLAETLVPVAGGTFTTNGCGAAGDTEGVKKASSFAAAIGLAGGLMVEGPKLLFVQSIGSPYDSSTGSAWSELATQLERLGATGSVVGEAREGYALVGGLGVEGLPLTEASQSLTGREASLAGVLEPNRANSFMPMLSSPGGAEPYRLNAIAYQPPTAWPESQSTEQKAALEYAAEYLKLEKPSAESACYVPARPDVRSEYCNLQYRNEWKTMSGEIADAPFQAGHGFTEPTWKPLREELSTEFADVQGVWNLVSTLQGAFNSSSNSALVNLKKVALEVEESTAPPAHSEVAGWWLELGANLLSIASYYSFGVEGEVVQKTTGTLSGALFIAAQLIFGPQGAPAAETFKLETADFATELAETYLDASKGLGLVGELLVSDYGKLTAVKKSGLLGISEKTLGKLERVLGPGSRSWSYQKLLPTSYEAIALQAGALHDNPLPENASEYECTYYVGGRGIESEYRPFPKAPKYAQLRAKSPTDSLGLMVLGGSSLPGSSAKEEPQMPPNKLLTPIFKPESEGGLGLYAPWFWRSAFGYPSSQVKAVNCG